MRQKLFALIDCNNFYCSCERVFNASIQKKPLVVLSNNDGCVVARTNDVKKLVKMGQPVFEIADLIREHQIETFSSNYSLYADISARVMAVLAQFSPHIEKYSIDEAFLDLTELPIADLTEFGQTIKAKVMQLTGIPVSVGIAPTKCLTKIAIELVKHDPRFDGVFDLTALSEQEIDRVLAHVLVEDVWGVGYTYAAFLRSHGILTARELKYASDTWIRKYLTVVGQRIVLELRGISCMPLESEQKPKKGIMSAKTFGREITCRDELEEALATYTARAAEKLREQGSVTALLTIFIQTNALKKTISHYANSISMRIAYPTDFTPDLIRYALKGLSLIYKEGYRYRKAGVYFSKIKPQAVVQPDLFGDFSSEKHQRQARFMSLVDAINRIYGRDTLFFAVQGITRPWKMQQHKLSQHFTTQWSQIYAVR